MSTSPTARQISEHQDNTLRMLLLAAEAITYGQMSVARRRVDLAQQALAYLPDAILEEREQ